MKIKGQSLKNLFVVLICMGLTQVSISQELTRILFVLDASNSMNGRWQSQTKMDIATDLLKESLDELKGTPDLELALRAYGHGSSIATAEQNCDDTELLVPFGPYRFSQIDEALEEIEPQGTTPIARSLERAAEDFPDAEARNVIILITDGIEACDEDPCAVSLALQRKKVILKPFIIGIGMENVDTTPFECIGNFFDASSEETFEKVLQVVISQALNNTTVQVDLLDAQLEPTVTNVPLTFSDSNTGKILYQFIHTMNKAGNPDTLPLDPVYTYDIIAHTLPPQKVDFQPIVPGEHTTITLEAPIGELDLKMEGRNAYKDLKCLIRGSGLQELVNVQDFNTSESYIQGMYDLEVLTLPRTRIPNVRITADKSTPIAIPTPGVLNLILPSIGYGCIQQVKGNTLEWVCNLDGTDTQQQFVLQPGHYRVLYRSRKSKQAIYTLEREFKIESESSVQIRF
ncbi:MAG: VWA domain-containing protein [Flavobacteriales bacterium]|nr:VWA domain-containing protein [Flavobacteriales bacterium]